MIPAPPIDEELLRFLNQPGNPVLDKVMQAASSSLVLVPLVCAVGILLLRKSPHRWLAAVLLALSVGGADLLCARVIKPAVARARPCEAKPTEVESPLGCGAGRSFPSNHAANSMAAAVIVSWALPRAGPAAIVVALLIGVSRVYLGEHWPTDVGAGWIIGAAMSAALITLVRLRFVFVRAR